MRRMMALVPAIAVLTASVFVSAEGPAPLAQSVQWPGVETVWQHETMYLASAPTAEGLAHAKTQGVTTVINLMLPDEDPAPFWPKDPGEKSWYHYAIEAWFPRMKPWNEAKEAEQLGLRYENVPISVVNPDPAAIQRYLNVVKEVGAKQLLIHCDAAGRALAMWAIYLGTAGGLTPELALAQAEQAGLSDTGLKTFVLNYLRETQKAA